MSQERNRRRRDLATHEKMKVTSQPLCQLLREARIQKWDVRRPKSYTSPPRCRNARVHANSHPLLKSPKLHCINTSRSQRLVVVDLRRHVPFHQGDWRWSWWELHPQRRATPSLVLRSMATSHPSSPETYQPVSDRWQRALWCLTVHLATDNNQFPRKNIPIHLAPLRTSATSKA